uniref:Uncharacterized protein n=1 Tax=Homalodisca liturata TaxID=320908 RepID=A0A1B6HM95_9HEMI
MWKCSYFKSRPNYGWSRPTVVNPTWHDDTEKYAEKLFTSSNPITVHRTHTVLIPNHRALQLQLSILRTLQYFQIITRSIATMSLYSTRRKCLLFTPCKEELLIPGL